MIITFTNFIKNAYYYFMEVLQSDCITKIKLEKGSVMIISEKQYDCLMEMLADKYTDKTEDDGNDVVRIFENKYYK